MYIVTWFEIKNIKLHSRLIFVLNRFVSIVYHTGSYMVQKWDINEQTFLESAPGLGMYVTITTPTEEVKVLLMKGFTDFCTDPWCFKLLLSKRNGQY